MCPFVGLHCGCIPPFVGSLHAAYSALRHFLLITVFQRSLKGISRKFQRGFCQVLGVLQEHFNEISRNLKGVLSAFITFYDSFMVGSSMFHDFFKVIQLFVYGCFIDV